MPFELNMVHTNANPPTYQIQKERHWAKIVYMYTTQECKNSEFMAGYFQESGFYMSKYITVDLREYWS